MERFSPIEVLISLVYLRASTSHLALSPSKAFCFSSRSPAHLFLKYSHALCAFAKTLGYDDAAELLHTTLEEEKQADITLTEAAYNTINFDAAEADENEVE